MPQLWLRSALVILLGAAPQWAFAAATVVDLTTIGSSATVNGAIYSVPPSLGSSGTGLIDSFVRIQNTGTESGFNTSDYASQSQLGPLDMKSGSFTHDVLVSDLFTNVVTINHVSYYEFVLDINQNTGGTNNLLSLDRLEIFVGPNATNTQTCIPPNTDNNAYVPDATQPGPGTLCGLSAVYSLDANNGTDYSIKLDFDNFGGSGAGLDMAVLVPTSLIGAPSTSDNRKVYLYSRFGELQSSNDGPEEWARKTTGTFIVPVPGTMLLLGVGLLALSVLRRRTDA